MSTPPASLTSGDDSSKHLVQQALAQIDEEISARYLPVCALRTKRNALSPISRLPDELLATVFIFYARQYHISKWAKVETLRFRTPPPQVPLWVGVSYVCRRWRIVALGCPTLWTYVFFVSRAWMTVLLQRSQMAPLRVRIDLAMPPYEIHLQTTESRRTLDSLAMLEMLFEHLPRMEEFRIRGLSAGVVRKIIPKLIVPAPLLQSLQITVLSSRHSLASLDNPPPMLPVVFSRSTPKLRSLHLSRVDIAWNSLTLTGMTSLRLSSVPRLRTMQELSPILSQNPHLTDLELEDVFPRSSSLIQDPLTEKITLPCLSRLSIMAAIPETVHFLSYVHVPLTTEIRLKCALGDHASLSQLLSHIQKRFSPHEDERETFRPEQPIRSMNIDGAPPWTFFVTCSTSKGGYNYRALSHKENFPSFSPHNYDWDRGIPLKIDLTDIHSAALTETVMVNIFQHLSLAHLQSIAVYIPTEANLSGIFWRGLFDLARELRFIKLRYTTLRGFVTTLAPGHRGWREQNQILPARSLEEIELEQVSFATECVADEESGIDTCDSALRCLCDALARRRDAGYPLRRIMISKSWGIGTNEEVEELRGVVSEVKWDGIDNNDFAEEFGA